MDITVEMLPYYLSLVLGLIIFVTLLAVSLKLIKRKALVREEAVAVPITDLSEIKPIIKDHAPEPVSAVSLETQPREEISPVTDEDASSERLQQQIVCLQSEIGFLKNENEGFKILQEESERLKTILEQERLENSKKFLAQRRVCEGLDEKLKNLEEENARLKQDHSEERISVTMKNRLR